MDAREKLRQAEADYRVGNFHRGTRTAHEVLDGADEADREKARILLEAMGTDPVATLVFGGTAFVMLFLIIRYLLTGH